jgi:hypothetical protein
MDQPNQNQNQMPINFEPFITALTGANILFDEEQFIFMLQSGNFMRRYALSPKHAKRFMLLLGKQIAEYEKANGALKTDLPPAGGKASTGEDSFGFAQGK